MNKPKLKINNYLLLNVNRFNFYLYSLIFLLFAHNFSKFKMQAGGTLLVAEDD